LREFFVPEKSNPGVSLTGLWHGRYSYPIITRAPVPFTANLIETGDCLGGAITERATIGAAKNRTLYATISGRRSGHTVRFMKVYEANGGAYTSVSYDGALSEDGLEIDGDWIAAGWSGRFLMIRASGLKSQVGRKVEEKV
jgi:hypothetical protein